MPREPHPHAADLAEQALLHELLGITLYATAALLVGAERDQLRCWLRQSTEQVWSAAQAARDLLAELTVTPPVTLRTAPAPALTGASLEAELGAHERRGIELYDALARELERALPALAGGAREHAAKKRIRRAEAMALAAVAPGAAPPFPIDGHRRDRPARAPADEHAVRAACAALAAADADAPRFDALAALLHALVHPATRGEPFRELERRGVHVTPVHFYQPLPDTGALSDRLYDSASALRGVDLNEVEQLRLARDVFPLYRNELDALPVQPPADRRRYYLGNGFFSANDAFVYWCMIRAFRPARVIEIGSGFSSRLAAEALAKNGAGELTCIEPFPDEVLKGGIPGLTRLIARPVQEVPLDTYDALDRDDVLFIDSSHVVKCQSDVNWLFFEVLPRVRPGVLVHIHDIYLPREYPKEWLTEQLHFWTEQYLLQAFLMFNSAFEVLFANTWMQLRHPEALLAAFPRAHGYLSGSFWMRRRD